MYALASVGIRGSRLDKYSSVSIQVSVWQEEGLTADRYEICLLVLLFMRSFMKEFTVIRFTPNIRTIDLPRTTLSEHFLASASFIRWEIKFRSISADRLNAKARTFDWMLYFYLITLRYSINNQIMWWFSIICADSRLS
jgi:hypothetical protein